MQNIVEFFKANPDWGIKDSEIDAIEFKPICSECYSVEVEKKGDICGDCAAAWARGYRIIQLAGRCASGYEGGHGTRSHAVEMFSNKAMCGAKPGKRSVGWSSYQDKEVTCPRCAEKVAKTDARAKRHAEIMSKKAV